MAVRDALRDAGLGRLLQGEVHGHRDSAGHGDFGMVEQASTDDTAGVADIFVDSVGGGGGATSRLPLTCSSTSKTIGSFSKLLELREEEQPRPTRSSPERTSTVTSELAL